MNCRRPTGLERTVNAVRPSISSEIEELKRFPAQIVRVVSGDAKLWHDNLKEMLDTDPSIAKKAGPELARKFIWEDMTANLLDKIKNEWL